MKCHEKKKGLIYVQKISVLYTYPLWTKNNSAVWILANFKSLSVTLRKKVTKAVWDYTNSAAYNVIGECQIIIFFFFATQEAIFWFYFSRKLWEKIFKFYFSQEILIVQKSQVHNNIIAIYPYHQVYW